ncbi:metallophosphoesterase [Paenibacillaceae bacterium]|nr:metallophosphoesterase [Paenibacillaceae bacterium]
MKARQVLASVSVMLIVVVLVNYYIGLHVWRLIQDWLPAVGAGLFWPVFAIISFSYLFGRLSRPKPLLPLFRGLKVIGSYYFAIMEFAVIMLPITDLLYLLLKLSGADMTHFVSIAGFALLAALALFLLWGSRNAWSTIVRTQPVSIDKQAGDLAKLRIAMASDLHLGNIVGNRHLKKMVSKINALKPDVVLLPGDVLDDSIEPFIRNKMMDNLKKLQARDGVYVVLGNHEYYGGSVEQYVALMEENGFKVLRDEIAEPSGAYYVVGRKDRTAESREGRLSVSALLAGLDPSRPIIVMDHQPYGFEQAAEAGADLLLCGHTHRGQIAPNHWITKRLFELDWGYMRKGKMHVAVSSGFGSWGPPIRIGSRSEIIELLVTFQPRATV